jgi:hypothetical protein
MTNHPNRTNLSETDSRDRGVVSGTNEIHSDRQPAPASPTAFQRGYADGRYHEQARYERNLEVRDNNNAARGLFVGILATSALAAIIGSIFLLNQANNRPNRVVPQTAQPAAPQQTRTQTEIRERETVREVPVPVVPDVNVTVPRTEPPINRLLRVSQPQANLRPANPTQGSQTRQLLLPQVHLSKHLIKLHPIATLAVTRPSNHINAEGTGFCISSIGLPIGWAMPTL